MSNLVVFGDSIAAGTVGPSWAPAVATALSRTLVNRAVSGYQAADLGYDAYGYTPAGSFGAYAPATDALGVIAIGTNDHRRNLSDPTKQQQFERFLRCAILAHAAPTRVTARPSGLTLTGTWAATPVDAIGKFSDTPNDKAAATVSGAAVYVQAILQNSVTVDCDVKVGGVSHPSTLTGPGMSTVDGRIYAPACLRVGMTGLTEVVRLAGGRFYIDQIIGSDQAVTPATIVCTIPRQTAAAYANQGGGSDTTVAQHNAIIASIVAELAGDGLSVQLCDLNNIIDPTVDTVDGTHFNSEGATKAGNAIVAVATGGITYEDGFLRRYSDGRMVAVFDSGEYVI